MSIAEKITVNANYTRSVNLERDCDSPAVVRGYIPTPPALHTLGRIADSLDAEAAPRAWSLVGPYGAGKSSIAAFLTHLLGAPEAASTRAARDVLQEAEPTLARRFCPPGDGHDEHPGHCIAILTGSPEPFAKRLAEALAEGAARYWAGQGGRRPKIIEALRRLAASEQATACRWAAD